MTLKGYNKLLHNLLIHHSKLILIEISRWFAKSSFHGWNKYSHNEFSKIAWENIFYLYIYTTWNIIIDTFGCYNLCYIYLISITNFQHVICPIEPSKKNLFLGRVGDMYWRTLNFQNFHLPISQILDLKIILHNQIHQSGHVVYIFFL